MKNKHYKKKQKDLLKKKYYKPTTAAGERQLRMSKKQFDELSGSF